MVATSETVKRKIPELRVVDLKNELEKRNLDKGGNKPTLVDRLTKAVKDEGHDPNEYFFEVSEKKIGKRINSGRQALDVSDLESATDGADVPNANELDEDLKDEISNQKESQVNDMNDLELPETKTSKSETLTSPPESTKMDFSGNQENCDAVDDCINLNVEDEENFEEEESHPKEKDEPPRRGLIQQQQREEKQQPKNLLVGVGSSGQTSPSTSGGGDANEGGKTNTASFTNNGDQDADEDGKECNSTGASSDNIASSTASGEKSKSGSAGTKDGVKVASKEDRDKKKSAGNSNSNGGSRNLWVSGLSTSTRATDLKHHFSKFGKVIGAKIVTYARTPGVRCFGYITMATSEDASKCIQHLHRTEIHGRMISVERTTGESGPRKADAKSSDAKAISTTGSGSEATDRKITDKPEEPETDSSLISKKVVENTSPDVASSAVATDASAPSVTGNAKEKEEVKSANQEDKDGKTVVTSSAQQQRDKKERVNRERLERERKDRPRRPPSPRRPRQQVLTFQHIREERERYRMQEREREEREAERRRREDMARILANDRKQRDEAIRLEKERERLRIERERLDREKAELLRLERERQRLEREKIEAEREELKRRQARSLAKIEEVRRATKRTAPTERDEYYVDHKRLSVDGSMRYDPASRFVDPKSGSGGHFGTGAASLSSDYRGSKVSEPVRAGYDNHARRFDRQTPSSVSSAGGSTVITRRVVQEIPSIRRDTRPPLPTSPPPPRDRLDDRRVVDRGRDDRYDRGNRSRDAFSDRDRERERERPRERGERVGGGEPIRNRMPERDHRDRYGSDSRKDHRYNERGTEPWQRGPTGVNVSASSSGVGNSKTNYSSNGSSSNILGNGVGLASSGNSWSSNGNTQTERWNSSSTSLIPVGRSISTSAGFNNNWTGSAPPLSSSVYNPSAGAISNLSNAVLGQTGPVTYSGDRYSRH